MNKRIVLVGAAAFVAGAVAMWTGQTEAQWEYACRAGTRTVFSAGNDETDLDRVGWYEGNASDRTHAVSKKEPNAWGLFDMHGNVWEFCSDGWSDHSESDAVDPIGDPTSYFHVAKGGGAGNEPALCRAASRAKLGPESRLSNCGFRIVCLDPPEAWNATTRNGKTEPKE